MITIRLNNTEIACAEKITLQELLNMQTLQLGTYAVAINRQFIPRTNYANTYLQQHDQIDLIQPMQGG